MERNFLYLLMAGFMPQGIHLLLLPVYSSAMGLSEFGKVGLTMVLINVASSISALQIQNSVGRLYFDYQTRVNSYFSTVLSTILILSIFFAGVSLALKEPLTKLLFSSDSTVDGLILMAIASAPIACLNQFLDKWFIVRRQGRELFIRVSIASLSSAAVAIYLVVYLGLGAKGYIAALFFGYLFAFSMTILMLRRFISFEFSPEIFVRSLSFSLPLIFGVLGGMLFLHFGVVILEKYVSLALVGVFVLADRISNVLKLFVNQGGRLIAPFITGIYTQNKKKGMEIANDIFLVWCVFSLPIFVLFLLAVNLFIDLWFPPEFLLVSQILPFLCVGCWFRGFYIYESLFLFAEKKTGWISTIGVSSGLLFVAMCLPLTLYLGLQGAVYAQVIGLSLPYFFSIFVTQRLRLRLTSVRVSLPASVMLLASLMALNITIDYHGSMLGSAIVLVILSLGLVAVFACAGDYFWKKYAGIRKLYKEGI